MSSYSPKTHPARILILAGVLCLSLACSTLTGSNQAAEENSQEPQAAESTPAETEESSSEEPVQTEEPQEPAETEPEAASPAEWQSNWLHFGVDDQFSSYKPDETRIGAQNVGNLELIHGVGCDDALFSVYGGTPAVYHGQIIITHAGGYLELGDPYTGDMAWQFGEAAYGWAPPPVLSTDGIIYYLYVAADASAKLYAVDASSGEQIWEAGTQFQTGFNFDAQVTVDEENDLVYVIEDMFGNGRLYAVERSTGEVKWFLGDEQQEQGEISFSGLFVLLGEGKLYAPAHVPLEYSKQLRMVRVDPLAQAVDLQYDMPGDLNLSWGVGWYGMCNEHLYATYQDSSRKATVLAAYALDQPGVAWQAEVPPQSGRFACDPQQGILYVPTEDSLIALHAGTGEVIWEHGSLQAVFTPTIANGVIYTLSDTNMYALDQSSGEQLFRYPLGIEAEPSTGVAVNDGLVIFSGNGGTCDLFVLGVK